MRAIFFAPHAIAEVNIPLNLAQAEFQSIVLVFSVVGTPDQQVQPEISPNDEAQSANNKTFGDVEDGAILSTQDLLQMEIAEQKKNSESQRVNLYEGVDLMAHFANLTTGETTTRTIAKCSALNFENTPSPFFDQEVMCDDKTYRFDASKEGVSIFKGRKLHMSLALDPGVYLLNGQPLTVK